MSNPTDGFFSQRTVFNGVVYGLNFRYNARMDRWLVDVLDANQNMLLAGQPLLGGWDVLHRFQGVVNVPAGILLPVDMSGQGRDPQEFTLGSDVQLFFLPLP